MPMAAAPKDFEGFDLSHLPHDANGLPVAGEGNEGLIQTSFGGAYDRQRMIWMHELNELERDNVPKTEKLNVDRNCLSVAHDAINLVQKAVNKAINEVPQPSWLTNPKEFRDIVNIAFSQTSEKKMGRSYSEGDGSRLDQVIKIYDVRPELPDNVDHLPHDLTQKQDQIAAQIAQMDALVKSIDEKFNKLAQEATPEEFKRLSSLGITSIDGAYGFHPGGEFNPVNHKGERVEYDPKNLIHVFQAMDHFMTDVSAGLAKGMRMHGPNAVNEVRQFVSDRMAADLGYNPGVRDSIVKQLMEPPRPIAQPMGANPYKKNVFAPGAPDAGGG